ncbi:MAG: 1-acyl-sn-glycerol-3-phosphate acyltransferase [Lachnospiraceae bacterium]|nr:1-acyl-sn-glycerol-3-phosphate acyltransferase [Lachnospiraceae bacterium]
MWKAYFMDRHDGYYNEARRYRIARHMVYFMKTNGRIRTKVYGAENLPETGGYVMYPNHQGKYDALGIIYGHKNPCTIVVDSIRSKLILTNEFIMILKGTRLDKSDMKAQVRSLREISHQVKEGRRYIIFPEGGYDNNHNEVKEFMPGAFKAAVRAKAPIVPVALIDSYKPFTINSLKYVTTQVHFLKPLPYEEYNGMTTAEISDYVRGAIVNTIREYQKPVKKNFFTGLFVL